MSISEMFERMGSLRTKLCGDGVTDREIAGAERALGVRFPQSYRSFLSKFGWARIHHDTAYGLGPNVPEGYELVKNALSERYTAHPLIPSHLVPIMNDGAGNNYCLDTSDFSDGECPVVFWDHEHAEGSNQMPQRVSPSFDRWLVDRIANNSCCDID